MNIKIRRPKMSGFGCTQGWCKQITSTASKLFTGIVALVALLVSPVSSAESGFAYLDLSESKRICFPGKMASQPPDKCSIMLENSAIRGTAKGVLKSAEEAQYLFPRSEGKDTYHLVLLRVPSNTKNRTGRCGAGYEDFVAAIKFDGKQLLATDRYRIQSCLAQHTLAPNGPDDILSSLRLKEEDGAIEFRWLEADNDALRVLKVHGGKFRFH